MEKEFQYEEQLLERLKRTSDQLNLIRELVDDEQNFSSPRTFIAIIDRGLDLARRARKKWYAAYFSVAKARCYFEHWQEHLAYDLLSDALRWFRKLRDRSNIVRTLLLLAEYHRVAGDSEKSIDYCLELKQLLQGDDDVHSLIYLQSIIIRSDVLTDVGDFVSAFDLLYTALQLSEGNREPGFEREHARVIMHLGIGYLRMERHDKATEYLSAARELEDGLSTRDLVRLYMNIANARSSGPNANVEEALTLYQRARDIANTILGARYTLPSLLVNIGASYTNLKKHETALEHYRRADDLARKMTYRPSLFAIIHLNRAATFIQMERYEEADAELDETASLAKRGNDVRVMERLHRNRSQLYEQQGKFKEALEEFKKCAELRSELYSQEKENAVQTITRRIEWERQQRKIMKLEQEHDSRARELQARNLQLTRNSALLKKLRSYLESLEREGDDTRSQQISLMLRQVQEGIDAKESWAIFEREFDRTHQDFVTKLLRKLPDLTRMEVKICILTRMNLPARSIADILFVSVHTVYTHTRNIRKKINPAPRGGLASYLAQV